MLTRRHLLVTGLAAGATAATGLSAQETARGPVPPEMDWMTPRFVSVQGGVGPGEIHVDPDRYSLYWTIGNGEAIRYAVGIGRPGLYEPGLFHIGAKKEWPSWTPTPDMIAREPELYARWADGMPGGPDNPLGARALYLFTPERGDTFMRIHGTNAPHTIGSAVSNGCVRLLNEHIVDLYDRVPEGTPVYLYPKSGAIVPA
jgi:lipoprotein-anchoring transpeptidase ErfK/SrfK